MIEYYFALEITKPSLFGVIIPTVLYSLPGIYLGHF